MPRPVLQVIAGSTRPGRKGIAVARWVAEQAQAHHPELVAPALATERRPRPPSTMTP